ncbi:MAG: phosphotransferase [Deltaproteobacteria bacterium]|nr:phosphotransferase [Deltaproteobacteria bacterium]MBW2420003.1 phosphotransferase [Deltaproteobacteria bacterium]
MDPSPYIVTAGQAAKTLGRILWDRAAEPMGLALPFDPARVTDPAFLNDLLANHAVDPDAARFRIAAARMLDIKSVSSNCNNVVIALEHEGQPPSSSSSPLPRSAFLKLPPPELLTRLFCNVIRVWELECQFYRRVAARVPFRIPKAYAVKNQGTRFVMLLENLHDDPDVTLHTNPDMLEGPSIEKVERCLATLGKLHASFSGLSLPEREELLPAELLPFTSPFMRSFSPLTGRLVLGPCRKKAPDLLTDDLVALFERALDHWDLLLEFWYREPLTLIHGDSHLGNFFVDGSKMGMLDWQATHWGKGVRDVQYLLIDSLPEKLLAANEEKLVQHYVAELAANGVTLPFDEAWEQYRALSFQTWMTIIVSLGTSTMIDMDEVMLEILARSNAAIRRLGFADWLEERIASA